MPLTDVQAGKTVKILSINGGRGAQQKLMALGIIPGVPVKVIQTRKGAPVIISVLGANLSLGYGISHKIVVK